MLTSTEFIENLALFGRQGISLDPEMRSRIANRLHLVYLFAQVNHESEKILRHLFLITLVACFVIWLSLG